MTQYVYFFGDGSAEGHGGMKNTLGGKSAGLAEMNRLGLFVFFGFTISTDVCVHYFIEGGHFVGLEEFVSVAMLWLEQSLDKKFG